jgi:hypothetical protein
MLTVKFRAVVTVVITLASASGCMSGNAPAKLPDIKSDLQLASAGHTGCLPGENEITNSDVKVNGTGTWNATCKGRTYLCAAVSSGNQAYEYSCAQVAQ